MLSHTNPVRWRTIARAAALIALMTAVIAAFGSAAGPANAKPLGQCDGPCVTQTTPPPPADSRGGEVGCHDCDRHATSKQKRVTVYRTTRAYSTPYLNALKSRSLRATKYVATCEANSGSRGRHSNPWWTRLADGYWVNNGDLRGRAKMGIGDCAAPSNDNHIARNPRGHGCDCDPPTPSNSESGSKLPAPVYIGSYGTYSFRFELWRSANKRRRANFNDWTASQMMGQLNSSFSRYFTFTGCGEHLHVGQRCRLNTRFAPDGPVEVLAIAPDGFAVRSLPGHPEGKGRTIAFRFQPYVNAAEISSMTLSIQAWGPLSGVSRLGPLNSRFFARTAWTIFKNNIIRRFPDTAR